MKGLMQFAGVCLLAGGAIQLWFTVAKRRLGEAWRGPAMLSAAMVSYGVVVLSGIVMPATRLGAVLVCLVAALIWAGVVVTWREASRASARRED